MVSVKKVGRTGGVTIPKELRRDMNINPGDAFEVEADERGDIVLKRYSSHCIFCEGTDGIEMFRGKPVCKGCKADLK